MHERTDTISNPHKHDIQVWFEPWGMPHNLPSGKSFTVVTTSDVKGELEIENNQDTVVVYAFPSATVKVFLDAVLIDDFDTKIPDLPLKYDNKAIHKLSIWRAELVVHRAGGTVGRRQESACHCRLGSALWAVACCRATSS